MLERVQKIIARAGVCSRRAAEDLIREGRVTVNGTVASIGAAAEAEKDKIMVNNKPLDAQQMRYILLHKPVDFVTSREDRYNKTIMSLVVVQERVFPVGRLDKDAEGLILLTNDGELAHALMHPRFRTQKTYHVWLQRTLKDQDIQKLLKGIPIENKLVSADKVVRRGTQECFLTVHEGQKHVVKKMMGGVGNYITRLVRTQLGPLALGKLRSGEWRDLTNNEVLSLRRFTQQRKQLTTPTTTS